MMHAAEEIADVYGLKAPNTRNKETLRNHSHDLRKDYQELKPEKFHLLYDLRSAVIFSL